MQQNAINVFYGKQVFVKNGISYSLQLGYIMPGKGLLFEIYADDNEDGAIELCTEFAHNIYAECPKEFGWFHQGGVGFDGFAPGNWHMFEFWAAERNEIAILEWVMAFCEKHGLEFEIGTPWQKRNMQVR